MRTAGPRVRGSGSDLLAVELAVAVVVAVVWVTLVVWAVNQERLARELDPELDGEKVAA